MRKLLAISLGCLAAAWASVSPARPTYSLAHELAAQLEQHPVIMLGEHHRSAGYHKMLQALLHDSDFVCKLDDIVLEPGSSLYQDTADRFVSGAAVPRDEKVRMWRDTTQWLVWDSPVYEQIFDTVREINISKRCPRPVRVVLAEPPIPWADVHSAADYRKYGERDQSYADIIEREVLARNHRALMVTGSLHVNRKGAVETAGIRPSAAELLEAKYPGKILSIDTIADAERAALLGLQEGWLKLVRGTALGKSSFVQLVPNASAKVTVNGEAVWKPLKELTWPPVQDVVDGFIYLGEDSTVDADPRIYQDPAYRAELRRRAPILKEVYFGMDFLAELEELLKAKSASK